MQLLLHIHLLIIICSESLLLLQRNAVDAWDMKGARPVFSSKRELQGLELPKGTVIEVELVQELQGEVSDLGLKREQAGANTVESGV